MCLHQLCTQFGPLLYTDICSLQPEFAHPYEILAPYCNITVASHAGGEAPLDQSSIQAFESDEVCARFVKTQEKLWRNTSKLEDFVDKTDSIDCIFYVGGYGRESFVFFQCGQALNMYH